MASELKVNKISPESGTTLTLGDSGDTINFGSGVLPNFENLTVTGDLTVDTNSLKVDSTNNFVGIGTATPSVALDVIGAITATGNITGTLATAAQPNITSLGTLTGLTTTGDINLGDNDKINIGASNDLQIYHDGSHSIIADAGTGNLEFRGTHLVARNGGDTGNYFQAIDGAQVELYYNGSSKMSTTSTGIDVTGTVVSDGLTVDGNATITGASSPSLTVTDTTNTVNTVLRSFDTTALVGTTSNHDFLVFANNLPITKFFAGGDVQFYEDTGTTPKFFWDASAERLGIGTTSPNEVLQVNSTSSTFLQLTTTNTGTANNNGLYVGVNSGGVGFVGLRDTNGNPLLFQTENTERMRIDSSGNVGIGNTTPSSFVESSRFVVGSGTSGVNEMMFLYSGTNTYGALGFADGTSATDRYRGMIGYDHSTDAMFISTAGGGSASRDVTIDSSGNVGIGTSSPSQKLVVSGGRSVFRANSDLYSIQVEGASGAGQYYIGATNEVSPSMVFSNVAGTERMRIDSSGNVFIGKTSASLTTNGFYTAEAGARIIVARAGGQSASFCRNTNDGEIVNFFQAGTKEGNISVSGTTVSYNGFTGTHWSRLSDNSKPTILKGTILESLDEMMDWYQVQFDITETDDEGNETTRTEKQSYVLSEGQSVGDVITYNFEGIDYQATIVQEGEVKHTKSKISDTVDAKNVYGVFMDWDNDDDTVNDMYVAQTGTFVVRMNSAETVSKGDLIQSNGDGTGKVQADDIIRASTVAKVLSTTKIETYLDGSYIVPCSLHC